MLFFELPQYFCLLLDYLFSWFTFQILDVIRTGVDKGPAAGYEAEAKAFGDLLQTPESNGLIGLFRGQTECKKNRFGAPEKKTEKV